MVAQKSKVLWEKLKSVRETIAIIILIFTPIIALGAFKIEGNIMNKVSQNYVSREQLAPIKTNLEKLDLLSQTYLTSEAYRREMTPLIKEVQDQQVQLGKIDQNLQNITALLNEVRQDLRSMNRNP